MKVYLVSVNGRTKRVFTNEDEAHKYRSDYNLYLTDAREQAKVDSLEVSETATDAHKADALDKLTGPELNALSELGLL